MSEIVKFGFEGHEVRTQADKQGGAWFSVNDICAPLEHSNPRKAVADLVDPDDVTGREVIDSMGRTQTANFVNESGMYALVLGSRLEAAKRFKRWITHEVLPALRKTGTYSVTKPAGRQKEKSVAVRFDEDTIELLNLLASTGLTKTHVIQSGIHLFAKAYPDMIRAKLEALIAKVGTP